MFKNKSLQETFLSLPDRPGVYIFKAQDDSVLYIGKAKSLKKRVEYYSKPVSDRIDLMVGQAVSLQFIEVEAELDALLLEAQMIQNHQPPFNVVYKGGRPFLYLAIVPVKKTEGSSGQLSSTKKSSLSLKELVLVRERPSSGLVVGQFLNKSFAREVYNALLKAFCLRLCNKKIPGGCVYWHIGQCAGLCRDDFDANGYLLRLKAVGEILTGGIDRYRGLIEKQIQEASDSLDFEKARGLVKHMELISQCGQVIKNAQEFELGRLVCPAEQKDVWILWPENAGLEIFSISGVSTVKKALWLSVGDPEENIRNYYACNPIARSIFTNFEINEKQLLELFLTVFKLKREGLAVKSSDLLQIEKFGQMVIFDKVEKTSSDQVRLVNMISQANYNKLLNLPEIISSMVGSRALVRAVDCFDISHKQGQYIVAACVRFCDGSEDSNKLRLFKIRELDRSDDCKSLVQAVERRYKDGDLPDLVVVDGGKGQFNAVVDVLKSVPVAALAKREERLFCLKNSKIGVKLDLRTPEGAFFVKLRDATHRRAWRYHCKLFDNGFSGNE